MCKIVKLCIKLFHFSWIYQGFGDDDEPPGLDPLPLALLFVVPVDSEGEVDVDLSWVSFETASNSAFTLS